MRETLLVQTLKRTNTGRTPVWCLGQAGRFHSYHQILASQYTLTEMYKIPEIAAEVSLAPLRDFNFDAATLFTDIYLPLQAMGMELRYQDQRPKLSSLLKTHADLDQLRGGSQAAARLEFQGKAIKLIRNSLPGDKSLIGAIGGPLSLFYFAVEGTESGPGASAHLGLKDGRFTGFLAKLSSVMIENMSMQARAGADTIVIHEPRAGEINPIGFRDLVVPALSFVLTQFRIEFPDVPIIFHSRGTGPAHWDALRTLQIEALGIDESHDAAQALTAWADRFAIVGGINADWLAHDDRVFEDLARKALTKVRSLPQKVRGGWVAGVGSPITPETPESHVRLLLQWVQELFGGAPIRS